MNYIYNHSATSQKFEQYMEMSILFINTFVQLPAAFQDIAAIPVFFTL